MAILYKINPATWWDWGRRGHFKEEVYLRNVRRDYRMPPAPKGRAGNGIRTRDINLGKVALYQLSYSRIGRINITKRNSLCKPPSEHRHNLHGHQCVTKNIHREGVKVKPRVKNFPRK
jgi:hypothetical protein